VATQSGSYFRQKHVGRGATFGDYDNDGDLDLLVVNLNAAPRLLRNDGGNRNRWLMVDVRRTGGKSHPIGARVTVTTGSLVQIQDAVPVRGYLSQTDSRCHFGLGQAARADRVEIRWPDRSVIVLEDVKTNQVLKVVQPSKSKEP